jgi:NADH-quinone oxidoreductase subunit L
MLFGDFFKDAIFVGANTRPWPNWPKSDPRPGCDGRARVLTTAPFWLALAGVALSYYMYMVNPALPAAIKRACMPIYTLLENKYYMDWFNENVLARGARACWAPACGRAATRPDRRRVVNGSWKLVGLGGGRGARFQSGYLYHYACDDPGRVCADDVFRLVQQVGEEEKWDC